MQLVCLHPCAVLRNDAGVIDQIASWINARVGVATYDVGHVVSTGSGGTAVGTQFARVCACV